MKGILDIYIDGACSGNPGEAAIGVVIIEEGRKIAEVSKPIGRGTNNIAEYSALIRALQEAVLLKAKKLRIYTDSELLYNQITGIYKVKNDFLKSFFEQAQHLGKKFENIEMNFIPREQNKDADRLATQALKKQANVVASVFKRSGEESPSSKG